MNLKASLIILALAIVVGGGFWFSTKTAREKALLERAEVKVEASIPEKFKNTLGPSDLCKVIEEGGGPKDLLSEEDQQIVSEYSSEGQIALPFTCQIKISDKQSVFVYYENNSNPELDHKVTIYDANTTDSEREILTLDFEDAFSPHLISFANDVNEDGYNDLLVIEFSGASNDFGRFYIYDPIKKDFSRDNLLSDLSNPVYDRINKTIVSAGTCGQAGLCYTIKKFKIIEGKFVLIYLEEQRQSESDSNLYVKTIKILKDGKLETTTENIDPNSFQN